MITPAKYSVLTSPLDAIRSVDPVSYFDCKDCAYWKSVSLEIQKNMLDYNNCNKRYGGGCKQ